MNSEPRIPTLLGLAILGIGLVVGVIAVNRTQVFQAKATPDQVPSNIVVTNLSDTSVSLYWQTSADTSGFVTAGLNSNLNQTFKDERDSATPADHKIHFVTLSNLAPNSEYKYKIVSSGQSYPDRETLTFKTGPSLQPTDYPPIIGVVLDSDMTPVEEAIVRLEVPGAQALATITKTAGNFILPLAKLRTEKLDQNFKVPQDGIEGTLVITNLAKTSNIKLKIPPIQQTLPNITLGQDYDFTDLEAKSTESVLAAQTINLSSVEMIDKYDFDEDGQITNLDGQVITKNFKKKNPRFDLNQDGIVNQSDHDLFNSIIAQGFEQSVE